jgi:hypothetical protein
MLSDDCSRADRRVPHKPNARLGSSGTSLVPHRDKPFPILTPDFVLLDREFDGTGFVRSVDEADRRFFQTKNFPSVLFLTLRHEPDIDPRSRTPTNVNLRRKGRSDFVA